MEWAAVGTWVVAVLIILPSGGALLPSLGALTMVALGGLAAIVVFALDGAQAWAWISVGLALAGTVLGMVGARTLVDDEAPILQAVREQVKGAAAVCVGMGLPFLAAAGFVSAAVAVSRVV